MNVWCHLPTIFSRRRILQFAVIFTLCVALITTLFFRVASTFAAPGVNQTISFQGRLLDKNNSPVPDGYYNVQFKIYQDGSGTQAGNPDGTLEWTETYINNNGTDGLLVKNGYLSVDLGSKNPFGTQVDWNQDTLWLSMNIAGSSTLCTTFGTAPCLADGEMLPMKRLTATPYALNSAKLNGKTSDDFIQNGTTQQTGDFNIAGTGVASILQGNTSVVAPLFDRANAGTLSIGSANATAIEIGSATGNQTISIGTGTGDKTVAIGSASGNSSLLVQGGTGGVSVTSAGVFDIRNTSNEILLSVGNGGGLAVKGAAAFDGTVTSKDGIISLSNDGSGSAGLSWLGTNSTAYLSSTGSTLALQGSGLDLLTAVNSNGQARIGIGNAAESGYALDVTGGANVSDTYSINGVSVLNSSGLNFSGTEKSTVSAATNQALQLTADAGVRIGDGTATGEPTLLTLDKSATTPLATGDAVLGSMYYDTTLGKLQCYEADGWGSCSSSPDKFVTLSPEYTNAVKNGTGIGELTSDICSDTLNINDGSSSQPAICGTNETFNFYKWTSSELNSQTKSIFVTYELPANFRKIIEGSTSVLGRTDSTDSSVAYQLYKNTTTGLVSCGTEQEASTGIQTTWQKKVAIGSADPANCSLAAGDSIVFKITLSAAKDSHAYVSTLGFAYSDD